MTNYRWIILDADGTLFDYEQAELSALTNTFRQFGLTFDAFVRQRYAEINGGLWQAFERGEISSGNLRVKRFEELGRAIGRDFCPSEFSTDYLRNLAAECGLLDGALKVVERLSHNFDLVLATNGIAEVQRSRFSCSGLERFFRQLVISDEIGIAKPDPGFFSEVFSRIGNPDKRHVLMVGDSLSSDIAGGQGFGIDTCWLNPSNAPNTTSVTPTFEIRSLVDLLSITEGCDTD